MFLVLNMLTENALARVISATIYILGLFFMYFTLTHWLTENKEIYEIYEIGSSWYIIKRILYIYMILLQNLWYSISM